MYPVNKTFGSNVRALRSQHGLTQEKLAHIAGINRAYMGEIERGNVSPTLNKMTQISKALEIKLARLLD